MAAGHKLLRTFLLTLLVSLGLCQDTLLVPRTAQFIGQNFCNNFTNGAITDNFSCRENPTVTERVTGLASEDPVCFPLTELCDDTNPDGTPATNPAVCETRSDEGDRSTSIDCAARLFNCGPGNMINVNLMCNGVQDCTNNNNDERESICDNKCLLDHYGGCSQSRQCLNSRDGVNCGNCADGFVEFDPINPNECNPIRTFSLDPLTVSTFEGSVGMIEVCAVLSSELSAMSMFQIPDTTVTFTIDSLSTATQNADFTIVQADLDVILSTAAPRACIDVTIIDDNDSENLEFVRFGLAIPSGNQFVLDPAASSSQIDIQDNDNVQFTFTANPAMASEDMPNFQFCIDLTGGAVVQQVTISLDPMPGSAVATDFNDATVTLTFPAGTLPGDTVAQQCGVIAIVNDGLVEPPESFQVQATPSRGLIQGQATATATVNIADNDEAIFQFTSATVTSSEAVTPAVATIVLAGGSGTLTQDVTINVVVSGGTATAGADFTNPPSNPIFMDGSGAGTTMNTEIAIINDNIVEEAETIILTASVSSALTARFVTGGEMATISITNDDSLSVSFQMDPVMATEDMPGPVMVCLVLSTATTIAPGLTEQVRLQTENGAGITGAVSPADFTAVDETITFPTGNLCISVTLVNDDTDEDTEMFGVRATPVTGNIMVMAPNPITVQITDDDLLVLEYNPNNFEVQESMSVQVCLDLIQGTVGAVALMVTVTDTPGGTATEGSGGDYITFSEILTFPSGTTAGGANDQQCFTFNPIDDLNVENPETINILATPSRTVTFSTSSTDRSTITILDNDMVIVRIVPPTGSSVPDFTVPEDVDMFEVCVELSLPAGVTVERPVTFSLVTMDGTGTNPAMGTPPADFQPQDFSLSISPGDPTSICRMIPIINDNICEFDESFNLAVTSTDPAVDASTIRMGTVTITDDDVVNITANTDRTIREDAGPLSIPITLVGQKAPGRDCMVTVSTLDGTAVSTGLNPDFTPLQTTLTLSQVNQFIEAQVEIINDGICEGNEAFQVMLNTISDGCQVVSSPINVLIVDDEIGTTAGDDPHFSIVLPSGKLLCFTVQGEHGFSFNLISNPKMTMNAKFVPDSRRSEVTWMGSMGIIVKDSTYKQENVTSLRFEAREKQVYIGDKVKLRARSIERMVFKNGKLTISEAPPSQGFKYPSVYVDLQDVEITFTMKFMNEHLDIFWHKTGKKMSESHGIIGQFFRKGVELDEVRKILLIPNKEPVPVMRRPVWSFMERQNIDSQLCWAAMNPGYQGEGLIEGTYFDYLVDDVMTPNFQFKKQQ